MFWNIFLATAGSLIQLASAFIRWRWTRRDISPSRQKWSDITFIAIWLIGTLLIGISTYRGNRQERAHFAFQIQNTYQLEANNGEITPYSWFVVDQPLSFNVYQINVGSGSAYNLDARGRTLLEPDMSLSSQRVAIDEFEVWLKSQSNSAKQTLPKGQPSFISAAGVILTPEDYNNIIANRKTVYVLARVLFEDDFGSHTAEVCEYLEPQQTRLLPAPFPGPVKVVEIFQGCQDHNGEIR